MKRYILLLGGNLDNPEISLDTACRYIGSEVGTILSSSPRIWTPPIGKGLTRDFLNQALLIESNMGPEELLDAVETIERKMGRQKPTLVEWNIQNRIFSDRIIDIDIAFADFSAGNEFKDEWHSSRLSIPHRAINERPFIGQLVSKII